MPVLLTRSLRATPPARAAGKGPFHGVAFEESTPSLADDLEWTQIDEQELDPLDADETEPVERLLTTDLAVVPNGLYRLAWITATGSRFTTGIVLQSYDDEAHLTPTVQQVADLVWSRTREDGTGQTLGTFSEDTEPPLSLVERLVVEAAGEIRDIVGTSIPPRYWDDARRVAAHRVASLIGPSLDDEAGTTPSDQRRFAAVFLEGRDRLAARPWEHGLRLA